MIFWGCLNTEVSPLKLTTCFWATTWTEGNSHWRPFVCSWPTRSSILRTSFSFEGTTSVPASTGSTGSMTNVSWGGLATKKKAVCHSMLLFLLVRCFSVWNLFFHLLSNAIYLCFFLNLQLVTSSVTPTPLFPSHFLPLSLSLRPLYLLSRQKAVQHSTMENIHRLLQLFTSGCHTRWEDILLSRR